MSAPKYTPGPWHIQGKSGPNYDGIYIYCEKYNQVGAAMTEANAALISAAPDLYEVLKYIVTNELLAGDCHDESCLCEGNDESKALFKRVMLALAKAEGK